MRKFIYNTITLTLPIFLLLISVNYFGDAARLFDNDYEKVMAKIVADGEYVTNFVNYDERLFQKEIIYNKKIRPNLVVIGSSRTMLINSDMFNGYTLFNNSVSGASLQDIIAIYQVYKDNNKLPEKIIIGIDPWTFKDINENGRWKSIAEYYYKFIKIEDKTNFINFKYKELFSLSYFQSSLKEIPKLISKNNKPIPSSKKFNDLGTKLLDGSVVYGYEYRNASLKTIENKMKAYIAGEVYGIENFNTLSDKSLMEFEQVILEMKKMDITVELFLTPYAPLVYDRLEDKYPIVLKTEKIVNDFAKSNNLKVYGSFNPYTIGIDSKYFYDGMHCKEAAIKKIIQQQQ